MNPADAGGWSIGVDIGGTFTDCAVIGPDGAYWTGKVPTTPDALGDGFFASIAAAASAIGISDRELLARATRVAHGTTAGINALVTRTGATVGLIATAGHGDALRIMDNSGRVTGASLDQMLDYSASDAPEQFVPRSRVREAIERIDCAGRVVVPLDEDGVRRCLRDLADEGVEALAVSLLWSHVNPAHEQRIRAIAAELLPDVFVSCSHEIAPRIGEYPRTATTVMNAFIGPLMGRYLDDLASRARERGCRAEILFATCEGGLVDVDTVRRQPLLTAQSGPVGGALASATLGAHMGFDDLIATDMGGTSLDASLIEAGRVARTDETVIERHQAYLRKLAVESIGTGGGSIAWYDPGKRTLRVGPRSAGAVPGPACYGRGGREPTVTDADLVLGLLGRESPLASGLRLDPDAAHDAVARLGERIGLDPVACAAGIVRIADNQMEDLLRRMTVQQGRDPRQFDVWAFGGAAGLHGGLYAAGLGVDELTVPLAELASVWSAYGIAAAEISRSFQRPTHLVTPLDAEALLDAFGALDADVDRHRARIGVPAEAVRRRRSVEMKYAMQWYSVEVPLPDGPLDPAAVAALPARFEETYEQRYGAGTGYAAGGMVVTAARVTMTVPSAVPRPPRRPVQPREPRPSEQRAVYWLEHERFVDTPILRGPQLRPGDRVVGPAIVEYPATTVAVRPGQRMVVDAFGNLVIRLRAPTSDAHPATSRVEVRA